MLVKEYILEEIEGKILSLEPLSVFAPVKSPDRGLLSNSPFKFPSMTFEMPYLAHKYLFRVELK
ncbi:hypothetical protein EPI10_024092 [Gossypium australe]|uniref:Uncharacterized protein n=1 Tax=Gossypium australe TaxID=47621 RepID=A0A5B6VXM3_9ROSI|nr:hypothetical protein EPI10_024092 [Gossypium australe]